MSVMTRPVCAAVLTTILCTATSSFAQERRTGLVVSTGSAVGLVLPISERLAIRPEMSFSVAEVESDRGSETETSAVTGAVSVLITLRRWDDLRTYVSPRLSFIRTTGTSVVTSGPTSNSFETTNTGSGIAGSFGADYRLGERFAIFGETGLTFSRQTSDSDFSADDSTSRSFGTRTAVGIVFFF